MDNIKLAVIGCGSVARFYHLPATALSNRFSVDMLVDSSLSHARHLADMYSIHSVIDDYREIVGKVDAAIVAVPNNMHAPVTIDLLKHGIHVLVEKPMALNLSECNQMVELAKNKKVVLSVGLMRRFHRLERFVKHVIDSRLLGRIIRFDYREGNIYAWPVTSDFPFRKKTSGGGVFFDIGVHVLDLLLWWFGECKKVQYYDDAMGGVEADCELSLEMHNEVTGFVELSRTRNLSNSCIITGEYGTLEVGTNFNPYVKLKINNQDDILAGNIMCENEPKQTIVDVFCCQLEDFADAILTNKEPLVSGTEGKKSLQLIEECYSLRQPLQRPWMQFEKSEKGFMREI